MNGCVYIRLWKVVSYAILDVQILKRDGRGMTFPVLLVTA